MSVNGNNHKNIEKYKNNAIKSLTDLALYDSIIIEINSETLRNVLDNLIKNGNTNEFYDEMESIKNEFTKCFDQLETTLEKKTAIHKYCIFLHNINGVVDQLNMINDIQLNLLYFDPHEFNCGDSIIYNALGHLSSKLNVNQCILL